MVITNIIVKIVNNEIIIAKVIELIELHILCFITFYRGDDSFVEKDRRSLKIIAECVK